MANKPNNPSLWSKAKSLAKQKFDVYPSAYANGWAAKWYKGHGGTWRKAEYGMEVPMMAEGGKPDWLLEAQLKAQGYSADALQQKMASMAEGGEPQNAGFQALPDYVQDKIMDNMAFGGYIPQMAAGGWPQQAAIAIAMKKAGKKPKQMKEGGDPDGEMAIGQIMAMHQKLSELQKFIQPDSDLEPWVASKLTLADDYLNSVADYMQYNPEENGEMQPNDESQEGLPMQQMRNGGYTVTRSNDRKGKTHKVTGPDGTVKYFGDSKLGQHPKDPERKAAFYARHKKNLAGNPYFRAFARATWAEGGEIEGYQKGGERTFLETASQFIPGYETYLDLKDLVQGGFKGDRAQMNQGVIGLGQPFAGKAITGTLDYLTEKGGGRELADYMSQKRSDIVNLSERQKIELFKRYGYGGYDKWIKDGKPKLKNGGYMGYDGKRHMSSTPTWSGNVGYQGGGETKPIITGNPKDPMLRAYRDSLIKYNSGRDIKNFIDSYHNMWGKDPDKMNDYLDYLQMINASNGSNIPIGTENFWGSWGGGSPIISGKYNVYKKPVQPVIYKKSYEDGGELPMAQYGLFSPSFFNNLSKFVAQQTQQKPKTPPAIDYNAHQQAYNINTQQNNGMLSVGEPQGVQLIGATNANPYIWQSYSTTSAPANPQQENKVEQEKVNNPIYGDVTKLQGTLKDGSMKDIRKNVNEFNKTYGSNLKVPFGSFGKEGRENMQKFGAWSDAAKMGIGMASAATDLFINNPAIKRENKKHQILSGMAESLNMAAPKDRGDWVAAGSRIGELRPDQYVVNKGMYTGQFYPTMNTMQFGGTGIIDQEISMPLDVIPTSMPGLAGPRPAAEPAENTLPANFKLTSSFEDYATKAEKYIRSVNPKTDVTGEMLAAGAQMAFEKTGKLVPVELALAQLQVEGYLAKGNKPNRPQRTKNPFNVGNTDDGNNIYHNNLQSGINSYYDLLTTRYLSKRSPEQLLENFVNASGNRYATDKTYENKLKQIVNQVQNRVFEEGGVYDLSEDEIKSILSCGGNVEFL